MSNAKNEGPLKVLIADDMATMRERLAEMLSQIEGLEIVAQAGTGSEASGAIQLLRPDLVILDIQMPDGNGIDVLREAKQSYPDTVVVMLTNHPYSQYRKKCAELGADYFLGKTTDSKLLIAIAEHLATARGVDNDNQKEVPPIDEAESK
jgi:DNA-binding NarL/FixJ family response regulator